MKKLYLVNTNARREFWTVEMLENGEQVETVERTLDNRDWSIPVVCILRFLECDECYDVGNCDCVEDDSSWGEMALTADELAHLFDDVEVLDERDFA